MPKTFQLETKDNETIELEMGINLSKQLDATHSPILFGCRTGICGTCLVNILRGHEHLTPASDDELELLEIMADDQSHPRLACQLKCSGDISIEYIGK
ncbi:MAG: ferredoxin [Halobacteriovoraceae bacterium]|nr:ferredoxin [Halobacteriovoraceae bacterium]|tara:strand:+ start:927 stop:1220 length:294 start_codon:yes stop_codon:yes gene_type:complete